MQGYSARSAFMFPGQGAQCVGMGSTIVQQVPKAKELFDKASEILGYDLLHRCTEGPKDLLDSTVRIRALCFASRDGRARAGSLSASHLCGFHGSDREAQAREWT
jgi:malonyl CoA-acyl carrier protein transacylase